jgi:hypothetical protein
MLDWQLDNLCGRVNCVAGTQSKLL